MATRSTIAVIHKDGTVSQVYCHWDGYLSHNGKLLVENYSTQERAEALVTLGDISSLGKYIEPTSDSHTFGHPDTDVTVYYGRDRGESDGTETKHYADVYEYLDKFVPEEYNYLFNGTSWGYQAYDMTEYVEVTSDLIEQEMA